MPIYDYKCKKCLTRFEVVCSFSQSDDKVTCDCGGETQRMVTCPAAPIFKEKKGTSLEDKFDYVAQTNIENAKQLRAAATLDNKGDLPYQN